MVLPVPLLAIPANPAKRRQLRQSLLVHAAPLKAIRSIVLGRQADRLAYGTWRVTLKAGSGWVLGKISRDYSIIDRPFAFSDADYAHYMYFFAGEPNWWGRFKNLTPPIWLLTPWKLFAGGEALLTQYAFLTVRGADVIEEETPLFWRADDSAVVVRRASVTCGAEIRPSACPGLPP
jgi:hypothetical protein